MAQVTIKPEYEQYVNAVIISLEDEGLTLSDYSKMLLRLSVEAWFEEPPQLKNFRNWLPENPSNANDEQKKILEIFMALIIEESSKEPHIEMGKDNDQQIPFTSLFYGLATSGRDVLVGWLKKGF